MENPEIQENKRKRKKASKEPSPSNKQDDDTTTKEKDKTKETKEPSINPNIKSARRRKLCIQNNPNNSWT